MWPTGPVALSGGAPRRDRNHCQAVTTAARPTSPSVHEPPRKCSPSPTSYSSHKPTTARAPDPNGPMARPAPCCLATSLGPGGAGTGARTSSGSMDRTVRVPARWKVKRTPVTTQKGTPHRALVALGSGPSDQPLAQSPGVLPRSKFLPAMRAGECRQTGVVGGSRLGSQREGHRDGSRADAAWYDSSDLPTHDPTNAR